MKVIIYSDVHGNKYALEKLQNTADYKSADLRIFLGDAVAMCNYPNECLNAIFNSGDIFVQGNHDIYCAYGLPTEEFPYFSEEKRMHQKYMREKTDSALREKIKQQPKDYILTVNGKTFYFTHFIWRTDKLIVDDPDHSGCPTVETAKVFENIKADYIFFGHNHVPADFSCDGKWFTSVGSLGMKHPGNYVVLEIKDNNVSINRKQLNFDVKQLQSDMLEENYPRATTYVKWFDEENF